MNKANTDDMAQKEERLKEGGIKLKKLRAIENTPRIHKTNMLKILNKSE